jgi:hypothetical protein
MVLSPDDPLRHPDLIEIARRLRSQLESVLDAERAAAHTIARRSETMRDRLIMAEDNGDRVVITCCDGSRRVGRLGAVGLDVIVVLGPDREQAVALRHIVTLETVT